MNALQRLDLEDRLMGLIADCLILEHPLRERMAHVTLAQAAALKDEELVSLTDRLTRWVANHQPAGLPAPAEGG